MMPSTRNGGARSHVCKRTCRCLSLKFERVLTASRLRSNSMLLVAQSSIGARAMSTNIALALLMVCSIYLAGRIAEHRGRSFKIWAWIGAIIGPLGLPLVFLFANLHGKGSDRA